MSEPRNAAAPARRGIPGNRWGELLLRVLEAAPAATGVGIDIHGPDIARGRENAGKRGLSGRVSFIEGPATAIPARPTPSSAAAPIKLDRHRSIWLRGHREVLGYAYLTLGVPRS